MATGQKNEAICFILKFISMHNVDILHVEDDSFSVEFMQRALKRLTVPLDYYSLPDGEQALSFFRTRERLPRLVVLDLKLPKVSGLQLLEALRSSERTRLVPVVMFSSSQEQTDVRESYRLGANSYLIKPLEYQEFFAVVETMVNYWLKSNYPV